MSRTYAIAEFLTEEQKARALSCTYERHREGRLPRPRTENHSCPLGMALYGIGCPTAWQVRQAIAPDSTAVEYQAVEFINDWDDGKIADLAGALGVQR